MHSKVLWRLFIVAAGCNWLQTLEWGDPPSWPIPGGGGWDSVEQLCDWEVMVQISDGETLNRQTESDSHCQGPQAASIRPMKLNMTLLNAVKLFLNTLLQTNDSYTDSLFVQYHLVYFILVVLAIVTITIRCKNVLLTNFLTTFLNQQAGCISVNGAHWFVYCVLRVWMQETICLWLFVMWYFMDLCGGDLFPQSSSPGADISYTHNVPVSVQMNGFMHLL